MLMVTQQEESFVILKLTAPGFDRKRKLPPDSQEISWLEKPLTTKELLNTYLCYKLLVEASCCGHAVPPWGRGSWLGRWMEINAEKSWKKTGRDSRLGAVFQNPNWEGTVNFHLP